VHVLVYTNPGMKCFEPALISQLVNYQLLICGGYLFNTSFLKFYFRMKELYINYQILYFMADLTYYLQKF
jgi:hypothetical protein